MKKQALGKGLKAFLPQEYGILKEEQLVEMDIDRLEPNPLQPRKAFDTKTLDELARSLQETGMLQPVVAVPAKDGYTIIVGERRWRAAQRIGLKKIPVLIRKLSREQQMEAALIENLQREDLNPIEVAHAYKRLMDELGFTQQDVAERVGKDRSSVTNTLRLLKLPAEVQSLISQGALSMGHARTLITLEDPDLQISLAGRIVAKDMSVRAAERLMQRLKSEKDVKPPSERALDADLLHLQEELLKHLGTKVTISGRSTRGVIKIHYFSLDDLNRIYERIKGVKS